MDNLQFGIDVLRILKTVGGKTDLYPFFNENLNKYVTDDNEDVINAIDWLDHKEYIKVDMKEVIEALSNAITWPPPTISITITHMGLVYLSEVEKFSEEVRMQNFLAVGRPKADQINYISTIDKRNSIEIGGDNSAPITHSSLLDHSPISIPARKANITRIIIKSIKIIGYILGGIITLLTLYFAYLEVTGKQLPEWLKIL